ncbi:MAG TPA: DUF1080 domain-containing protein [Candidatus Marinimicrobia bacterium]|nr:MAG: DUF1080 domain-containing protein [Candidatus Neomarinimicrobiota bacterium]HIA23315.1 DUF1080 domain-containing protein [Candidatus Neomarinimicrobiota bacterium]HIA90864.1 DUF1080 domain-containing protein [Candidatus Neomarinimicrobiota bacterium]HIB60763.1 DUF1080 domain-containing protein [Candidatus Neomarinimicrobiota bacterium]
MQKLIYVWILLMITGYSSNGNEWTILFDGQKVNGLRGYKQQSFPKDNWSIENGTLKTIPPTGIDLISEEIYKDFELELEWKVSPAGNSGIFYFATEDGDWIWQSALEMQVLDDEGHPDRNNNFPKRTAGSLYDLIGKGIKEKKYNPAGEWNHVRIVCKNYVVQHWLNGGKVLEYVYGSDEFKNLIANSKFATMPYFAKARAGHIGLQHHGEEVWYRNVRIRKL